LLASVGLQRQNNDKTMNDIFESYVARDWMVVAAVTEFQFVYEYEDGTELRIGDQELVRFNRQTEQVIERVPLPSCYFDRRRGEEHERYNDPVQLLTQTLVDHRGLFVYAAMPRSRNAMCLVRIDLAPLKLQVGMDLLPYRLYEKPICSSDGLWLAGCGKSRVWRVKIDPFSLTGTFKTLSAQVSSVKHIDRDGGITFAPRRWLVENGSAIYYWFEDTVSEVAPPNGGVSNEKLRALEFSRLEHKGRTLVFGQSHFDGLDVGCDLYEFERGVLVGPRGRVPDVSFKHHLARFDSLGTVFLLSLLGGDHSFELLYGMDSEQTTLRWNEDSTRCWLVDRCRQKRLELRLCKPSQSLTHRVASFVSRVTDQSLAQLPEELNSLVALFRQTPAGNKRHRVLWRSLSRFGVSENQRLLKCLDGSQCRKMVFTSRQALGQGTFCESCFGYFCDECVTHGEQNLLSRMQGHPNSCCITATSPCYLCFVCKRVFCSGCRDEMAYCLTCRQKICVECWPGLDSITSHSLFPDCPNSKNHQ
jgi:hypothetical protein